MLLLEFSLEFSRTGIGPQIISTSDRYTLTEECAEFLTERLAAMVNASNLPKSLISKKETNSTSCRQWVKIGSTTLYQSERNSLLNGKWLSDLHILAAQQLLQIQFKHLGGLQSTLYQQLKKTIKNITNAIQILYVDNNHWTVMTTIDCESQCQARYYDSHYAGITPDTERIIYNQLPTDRRHNINIDVMKIPQQLANCRLWIICYSNCNSTCLRIRHN